MAKLLKLRRGTTTQHGSFTGAEGEVTVDTDKDVLVVHDGSTAGGHPVAAEDMANVSSASIAGRLANDSLATSKLAAGALPTDVTIADANVSGNLTIESADIVDGTIVNADVNASAAIAGTKISPDFGSQNITTTGTITSNDITIQDQQPRLNFIDNTGTPNNPDYLIQVDGGQFVLHDSTNTANKVVVQADGHIDVVPNCDFGAGIDVTGNITCTGTVDGVDVATRDTLFGGLTSSSGVLTNGVTATTQGASDNTTKVATTAYVTTAIGNADAFPSGTKMIFQQTSAPTGWTKITSDVDNRALRVVSGTAGTGGTNAFSNTLADRSLTANAANSTQGGNVSVANTTAGGNVSISNTSTSGTVNSHTLSTNEMPSHSHGMQFATSRNEYRYSGGPGMQGVSWVNYQNQYRSSQGSTGSAVQNSGGGGSHSHGFSGGSHTHNGSLSGTAHTHNANFSGSAHNHSISVGNLDMAVQYLDVIIASKD